MAGPPPPSPAQAKTTIKKSVQNIRQGNVTAQVHLTFIDKDLTRAFLQWLTVMLDDEIERWADEMVNEIKSYHMQESDRWQNPMIPPELTDAERKLILNSLKQYKHAKMREAVARSQVQIESGVGAGILGQIGAALGVTGKMRQVEIGIKPEPFDLGNFLSASALRDPQMGKVETTADLHFVMEKGVQSLALLGGFGGQPRAEMVPMPAGADPNRPYPWFTAVTDSKERGLKTMDESAARILLNITRVNSLRLSQGKAIL